VPEENERVGHCQANHERIVDAIRGADVKHSQTLLAEHIRDTLQSYLAASRGDAPRDPGGDRSVPDQA
jgi:hypothetical protein